MYYQSIKKGGESSVAIELNTGFPIYVLIYIFMYFKYWKNKKFENIFWISCFAIYMFLLIDVTIFPIPITLKRIEYNFAIKAGSSIWHSINLLPDISLGNVFSRNFFYNMVMTAPFGFLVNVIFLEKERLKKTILWSLLLTLSIELTQLIFILFTGAFKIVDVNDIVANILGGLIGYSIYLIFNKFFNKGKENSHILEAIKKK